MITMGGNAELELVDSLDPFSEGILFSVMPPKKSWKNISNLSGGEKTLSSLALVFALHHFKPTPLYVMDEIDAALDFRNVRFPRFLALSPFSHCLLVPLSLCRWALGRRTFGPVRLVGNRDRGTCNADGDCEWNRCRLWRATSRNAPRTPSSSLFRCGITCSSSRRGWWAFIRSII